MTLNKLPVTTIDLIRHGEPVGGKRYRGHTDDPLSEKGWLQMRSAIADQHPWDAVVCSPLSRCRAFARELAARHALPCHDDPRFMEINFGEWEGCTAEELMKDDSQALYRFWSDPLNNTPPGAEALADFEARVISGWNEMLKNYAKQHVLLVGHAGVIRMIIRHVLDMPLDRMFRLQMALAGISRIEVDGEGKTALPRLVFHGGQL